MIWRAGAFRTSPPRPASAIVTDAVLLLILDSNLGWSKARSGDFKELTVLFLFV